MCYIPSMSHLHCPIQAKTMSLIFKASVITVIPPDMQSCCTGSTALRVVVPSGICQAVAIRDPVLLWVVLCIDHIGMDRVGMDHLCMGYLCMDHLCVNHLGIDRLGIG